MGIMAHGVRINTSQQMILYRDFVIVDTDEGWFWRNDDFTATGTCQTVFEAIEAVENWHDNCAEAAWVQHQQDLMESGGPDDSAYRRDMIAAGRGHLLGGQS
jgi:hypothetical protein